MLPGSYEIKITAVKDFTVSSFKRADPVSRLDAKPGHTYIPNAVIAGDLITIYFEDKGPDFPRECLPLYIFVNESGGNPGLALYKSAKKCDK